jgi:CheY-like chemotaxis protein
MLRAVPPLQCSIREKQIDPSKLPLDEDQVSERSAVLRKVMVVDDEADLADLSSMLLSAHGLDVVTVYSAEEALNRLEQDPQIDAVVSDIVMPGMNGLQLGDAIREMYPRVKVVLVSGFTSPNGFDGRERPYLFTTKPHKIATILELLRT